jgi:hypothetical protein
MILTLTARSGCAIAFACFKAGIAEALVAKNPTATANSIAYYHDFPRPLVSHTVPLKPTRRKRPQLL